MWKSENIETSDKKAMKKFYELFVQPSYIHTLCMWAALKGVKAQKSYVLAHM